MYPTRVHENALNFVDSGSGEIDSGTEQYINIIYRSYSFSVPYNNNY